MITEPDDEPTVAKPTEFKIDSEERFSFVLTATKILIFDKKRITRYPVESDKISICIYDDQTGTSEPNYCYLFYRSGEQYEESKGREFAMLINWMRTSGSSMFKIQNQVAQSKGQLIILSEQDNGCREFFSKNPEMLHKLEELNAKLCKDNLHLEFDLKYNLSGNVSTLYEFDLSTLCLYYNKTNCVSSIQIEFSETKDYFSINSYTHDNFQRRKYNSLLRAAILILSPYLTCNGRPYRQIHSLAIDVISAYSLNKAYDITCAEYQAEFDELKEKPYEDFKMFWGSDRTAKIVIPLSPANLAKAEQQFTILSQIVCRSFSAGSKKTRRRKKSIKKRKKRFLYLN
jgi:hypothetical protein